MLYPVRVVSRAGDWSEDEGGKEEKVGFLLTGTRSTSAWGNWMAMSLRENMRWKGSAMVWTSRQNVSQPEAQCRLEERAYEYKAR